ncbi:arylsulfatase [Prosthecobacter sp.]|jgi:arylsulfatase A-like enzyme|uniref:arylsulfatase n=1 Tax=Prosthecobacter sp. TaxID=1965333 RepID=UPI0037CA3F32
MKSCWIALILVSATMAADKPNVVLLYADDLGYGDMSCYGAKTISTPHIDKLAAEGLRFTDGHCSAATCTPSRFAMLTGEYAFRQKGTGILPGDAKMIIPPGRATLASVFKGAGYQTGVVGKWHLGLGDGALDWNGAIQPGPLEIGFDHCFIMAATGDRVPCVFVKDHQIVGLDPADPIQVSYKQPFPGEQTGKANPELLKMHPSHGHDMALINGISRIGYMKGGKSALWKDEDMADTFTSQAVKFIEASKGAPFFLYFAAHDPHVPRVPHPRFAGKSGMGPRGDAILQFDDSVGTILAALDKLGLKDNTLVLLSSDNGPVVDDGYQDEAVEKLGDHKPAGPLRGGKYSAFEGGTRVPFIVRWPAKVKAGVSSALVCQVDFPASFAALTGQPAPAAAVDSQNILPALLGTDTTGRTQLVEQGGPTSLRDGDWKFIPASPGTAKNKNTNSETGNAPGPQLYDLSQDIGESQNLAKTQQDRVKAMASALEKARLGPGK